jgi:hypothetical protein
MTNNKEHKGRAGSHFVTGISSLFRYSSFELRHLIMAKARA